MFSHRHYFLSPIAAALLISFPLSALAAAGKAIFVIGNVSVVDSNGGESRIKRGGEVNQGDTIVTNERSQLQIRMSDGTLLAVRPSSQFRIDDYEFNKEISTDKSFYSLVQGGFRSITGNIGKVNKSAYGVNTLVGTIGIRGTDFSARLCSSDCGDMTDGLYVGVMDGKVVLNNDAGEVGVLPGEYGFMQDQFLSPVQLETPPGELLFAHTDTTTHTEIASTESTQGTSSNSTTNANTINSDTTDIVVAAETKDGTNLLTLASAEILDPIIIDDPVVNDPVITDPIDNTIALPSSGTAIYQVSSSSLPTDGISTGTLNDTTTSLTVNFVDPSATASIGLDFNNDTWTSNTTQAMAIANDGSFSGDLFTTATSASGFGTTRTGGGTLSGSLSGVAEATIGAPSDATMSYSVNDGITTVTGDVNLTVSNTSN